MAKRKLFSWQTKALVQIKSYNNVRLLEETLAKAGGDNPAVGGFTKKGWWIYSELKLELYARLGSWLTKGAPK